MGFFDIADISSSGMSAEQMRMNVIADNIANSETTNSEDGGPYKRKSVMLEAVQGSQFATVFSNKVGGGVKVSQVVSDKNPPKMVFDPNHPNADKNGYVKYPNVSVVNEMVDMLSASRAYEANITMFNLAKNMELKALDIGR
ncbi:MAG: flagellar basal body rod protein FlgC [Candidatus Margulisiibacteriota bacterium]|nr:MAG: flagellar basal body rod protein FlgC [Candidatus Margulisiibacteriota bacterium]HAR64527.1 flagellar basal body rod protein FlgC [Candidatus Margulisiibacteriota bacterium]HCT84566.1 flagellar basal body rod protein FlgC [Candidatus Margulisiibacteriota bacterium]HCY37080.1 flagellar basal body rod protein FlgC [Candidatus Margulisiibacteriota bacterium]